MGGLDATLTANGGAARYGLFRTTSTLTGGVGPSAGVGVRIIDGLWAEFSARYHSARLETRVTNDVEAANASASENVQQVQLEGGALWMPARLRLSRRLQLHATAGGGFMRQLHGSGTLGVNGRSYYAGGGGVIPLPSRQGRRSSAAVRVDLRAALLQDGIAFSAGLHPAVAASASLLLRF